MQPKEAFVVGRGDRRVVGRLGPTGLTAYRPNEMLVIVASLGGSIERALATIQRALPKGAVCSDVSRRDEKQARGSGVLRVRFQTDVDVPALVAELRRRANGEKVAYLNTVLTVGAITADPMRFTSLYSADPMRFTSNLGSDPMRFTNFSTARPADSPSLGRRRPAKDGPIVAVLDTGVRTRSRRRRGEIDVPNDLGPGARERPDVNRDKFLDVAAGHNAFIVGIVRRAAPTARLYVSGVIENDGDGDEATIADALQDLFESRLDHSQLIVNLSFSGYYDADEIPPAISAWIEKLQRKGSVIVAAAGNDGSCRVKYPAALPEVISVAAVGPCGAAPFSNHGAWVDACAPGEDIVSSFFTFDGKFPAEDDGTDIDRFTGGAMWSGTSFSTPIVVGAIAELMVRDKASAKEAAKTLLGTPGLFRLPDYGVVVNRVF